MDKESKKSSCRIGLRTPGSVVIEGLEEDFEITDSDVTSLIVKRPPAERGNQTKITAAALLGDGLLQVAAMVAAAGAARVLGLNS